MRAEDRYDSLIVYYAEMFGRMPAQVKRQIRRESGFDPDAASSEGAVGLMQFESGTWFEVLGLSEARDNPEFSIHAGCKYMSKLEAEFGSLDKALAAYNWGQGHLRRLLSGFVHQSDSTDTWLDHTPQETQQYVKFCMNYIVEFLAYA